MLQKRYLHITALMFLTSLALSGCIFTGRTSLDLSDSPGEYQNTSRESAQALVIDLEQPSQEEADAPQAHSEKEAEASLKPWQQAYLRYLSQDSDPQGQQGYNLISVSDDGIPQLVEVGIDSASGSRVIHYARGTVHVTQMSRIFFSYIPGGNLLCNSEGLMDHYYDDVYRLEEGEMKVIASGAYGAADNTRIRLDSEGSPIYQYQWNGIPMSKEDYEKEFSGVYDQTKAVRYDEPRLYNPEEIVQIIKEYSR